MNKKSISAPKIKDTDTVSLTLMGDILEVKYLSCRNTSPTIRKIDKTHYEVISTGEIFKFSSSDNRSDNLHSFAQSFKDLRNLINANYRKNESDHLLWLTLTFAENITDEKVFAHCFDIFWKRMKRYFIREDIHVPKYITCVEPQSRGAWHGHMLLFFDDVAPFISNNDVLEKYWEWGFTKVQRLDGISNVGAYLTAYLTDLPLDEITDLSINTKFGHEVKSIQGEKVDKKFVKGGRLHLYPVGMKLYRSSQGLNRPTTSTTTFDCACDTLESLNAKKCYEYHVLLEDTESEFSSIVSTTQYLIN